MIDIIRRNDLLHFNVFGRGDLCGKRHGWIWAGAGWVWSSWLIGKEQANDLRVNWRELHSTDQPANRKSLRHTVKFYRRLRIR